MAPKRLGKLPPSYSFILNPHDDVRLSKCPKCDQPARLRKFVLFMLVDGHGPLALGKTSRFCPRCDLIMVHQDELEHELVLIFESRTPDVIGNEYLVVGTMERKIWRRSLKSGANPPGELLDYVADFRETLDLHYGPGGWYSPET